MKRRTATGAVAAVWAILVFCAGEAPAADYQTLRDVTYVERGGEPIKADVYVPNAAGPLPAVLLVHGGAWRSGRKAQMAVYADKLASAGFTCVAIDYRLAPEHPFPAQIEDCKSADVQAFLSTAAQDQAVKFLQKHLQHP